MNLAERNIIHNNINILVEKTNDFNTLLQGLHDRNVFNSYMVQEIKNEEGHENRVKKLYEYVTTRGPAAFEQLISCLKHECSNSELANILIKERYNTTDYLTINVKHSDKRYDGIDYDGIPTYHMGSKPKGYALIINMHDFCNARNYTEFNSGESLEYSPGERRFGSYRDVANLYTLLSQLGYEVTLLYDLTKERFLAELIEFRNKPGHASVDSCMVVVMSHGIEEKGQYYVKSYDNQKILCTEIWKDLFNSNACPMLHGKPKIFIFQICRGDENDMGVQKLELSVDGDSDVFRYGDGPVCSLGEQMSQTVNDLNSFRYISLDSKPINEAGADGSKLGRESQYKDYFIIYPSTPGTTSKRDTFSGAWLIQAICKVFMEHAHNRNLATLMRLVSCEIDRKYDSVYGCQSTWKEEVGSKLIYFNPGLYDDFNNSK